MTEEKKDIDRKLSQGSENDRLLGARIEYTKHIVDTHFSTFGWIDVKMQALLVIATAALAAATFSLKEISNVGLIGEITLVAAFVFLAIGMLICLVHISPTLNSGIGNENNPRSVIGTVNRNKEEYFSVVSSLLPSDMLMFNAYQISGMARINSRGQRRLAWAIRSVGMGMVLIFLLLAQYGYSEIESGLDDLTSETQITASCSHVGNSPEKEVGLQNAQKQGEDNGT
jgi:hypothetical protein